MRFMLDDAEEGMDGGVPIRGKASSARGEGEEVE